MRQVRTIDLNGFKEQDQYKGTNLKSRIIFCNTILGQGLA